MKKPRIPLNGEQQGLNAAFAHMDLPDLPLGPAAPANGEGNVGSREQIAPPARRGRVVLRRETAHRRGKAVVVIHDFEPQVSDAAIALLAAELKQSCGCGGSLREREIELQGEQTAKVREFLESKGFRVDGVR